MVPIIAPRPPRIPQLGPITSIPRTDVPEVIPVYDFPALEGTSDPYAPVSAADPPAIQEPNPPELPDVTLPVVNPFVPIEVPVAEVPIGNWLDLETAVGDVHTPDAQQHNPPELPDVTIPIVNPFVPIEVPVAEVPMGGWLDLENAVFDVLTPGEQALPQSITFRTPWISPVHGGSGADTLNGGADNDELHGEGGDDLLFGGALNPDGSLAAGSGGDILNGGFGDDRLWGGDGNDDLRGASGSDWLVGGAGDDFIDGSSNNDPDSVVPDYLFGGDFAPGGGFLANSGDDWLYGGKGNDGLWGADGNDRLKGRSGDDYIEAGAGNDYVSGSSDDDTLLGQEGDDEIWGGDGFDYLYGGGGADTFFFTPGDSYDSIWDFSAAEGDKLRLDLGFGMKDFADFTSRLSGYSYEGADYTILSLVTTITTTGDWDLPSITFTLFDQITIRGIAHTDWTPALVEGLVA